MTEDKTVLQQKHDEESLMNGAAVILADGREVPITDAMVQQSLEAFVESKNEKSAT